MTVVEITSQPTRSADPAYHRPIDTPCWGTSKIQPRHLDRMAIVYVRQSTAQQVLEHRESAALQYDLRRRAIALGWAADRAIVIDEDQGLGGGRPKVGSASSASWPRSASIMSASSSASR
jgi:hypothetical protein